MALGEMTDAIGDGVEANHTGATVFAADPVHYTATPTGLLSPEAKERLS